MSIPAVNREKGKENTIKNNNPAEKDNSTSLFSLDSSDNSAGQKNKNSDYGAKDIEVLEGLEPVRKRPGMYIGGTDSNAYHHMAAEVIDNSMDEAVAGFATHIVVELHEDGKTISISDNGRGIPVDPHPKFPDKSALEVIMTTLHSGGKFSNKAYQTSGGLHGVGLSVVNALSEKLDVTIIRDRKVYTQSYSRGYPITPLGKKNMEIRNKRGTKISFTPDSEIFGSSLRFNPSTLFKMLKSKAYLFKGVEIRWICAENLLKDNDGNPIKGMPAQNETLKFPGGLLDYVNSVAESRGERITKNPFYGESPFKSEDGKVEWAVTWIEYGDDVSASYCNTIPTPLGGNHENGIKAAITKGLRSFGEMIGNKKAANLSTDDCLSGAILTISAFIKEPQFQGQTKDKLVTPGVAKLVENTIRDKFDHWLLSNKSQAQALLEYVINEMEDRKKRKQNRETARQSATQKLRLPGKLTDCTNKNMQGTEIFLVEGDSAGGSARQARDRNTQAILPLRGKILNVANATMDKLLSNQEIKDLSVALGCGIGKDFDINKLRYERVIIMTDADVDGAHIASLLMTFFFKYMKPLVTNGHLYIARPPLYKISSSSKTVYANNDEEKEIILQKEFAKNAKVEVSRFKGLGEMLWKQLKETTMDPKKRMLYKVCMPYQLSKDVDSAETIQENINKVSKFINDLMGKDAEKRYNFILENAKFVIKNLDV